MRSLFATAVALVVAGSAAAAEPIEILGLKGTLPAAWKPLAQPGMMRTHQLTAPKADGDTEDADVSVFVLKGAGTAEQNLERQRNKFVPAAGGKVAEKLDKMKVGGAEATYQDLTGAYKKKPFPMAEKFTEVPNYRQIYVLFEKDGQQAYVWLLGPAKTVEKHKAAFDEMLKGLK